MEMETCDGCCGTGCSGHPDSGYTCSKCGGSGGVMTSAPELAGTLWQWLELAERAMEDHAFRLDANRVEDFCQGIRETKSVLAKLEGKG